tara:strand:+ start:560 stop:1522 length:963 start_codon:yes stop_codon:yes gene_type:complete
VAERLYPSDLSEAALLVFLDWFGRRYARSTQVKESFLEGEALGSARINVGRHWELVCTLVNSVHGDADLPFEAARASVEQRLDLEGLSYAMWIPPGAELPVGEPGLSELALVAREARPVDGDRLELRRPVNLYLRRTSLDGSVVTVLGGLSPLWAQFTNRVAGSFQLNAQDLFRLPEGEDERTELIERIVLAAGQPDVDDSCVISADDVWSANKLSGDRSFVIGSPVAQGDEASAALRRTLRKLLREAQGVVRPSADARALVILAAATELSSEKVSLTLRGMDPTLYSGYDLIAVVADGQVRVVLDPQAGTLPWDAPLPN